MMMDTMRIIDINEYRPKLKFKKDALEPVDVVKEYLQDRKYKTELCKTFTETGFCTYGNKCRFAHGKQELFSKAVPTKNYKLKDCSSFFKQGTCVYGQRCHFKHDERKHDSINRSYYSNLLEMYKTLDKEALLNDETFALEELTNINSIYGKSKRLKAFKQIASDDFSIKQQYHYGLSRSLFQLF